MRIHSVVAVARAWRLVSVLVWRLRPPACAAFDDSVWAHFSDFLWIKERLELLLLQLWIIDVHHVQLAVLVSLVLDVLRVIHAVVCDGLHPFLLQDSLLLNFGRKLSEQGCKTAVAVAALSFAWLVTAVVFAVVVAVVAVAVVPAVYHVRGVELALVLSLRKLLLQLFVAVLIDGDVSCRPPRRAEVLGRRDVPPRWRLLLLVVTRLVLHARMALRPLVAVLRRLQLVPVL